MKKSFDKIDYGHIERGCDNAISRATKQMPTPELSYGFDIKLANRLNEHSKRVYRRQRLWEVVNNISIIALLLTLAIMATKRFITTTEIAMPQIDLSVPTIYFSSLKEHLTLPVIIFTIGLIALLLADAYLRQKMYMRHIYNKTKNKA